jgi:hypothetical protein
LNASPKNVRPTRKNITKMNMNKFLMHLLKFFWVDSPTKKKSFTPPPRKKILDVALSPLIQGLQDLMLVLTSHTSSIFGEGEDGTSLPS